MIVIVIVYVIQYIAAVGCRSDLLFQRQVVSLQLLFGLDVME